METLHFSIKINAPKEHVWNTMLADKTFRQWSNEISEGSHYEGTWEQGSKIKFIDSHGNGTLSRIAENKPYEFTSIENYGAITNGIESTESQNAIIAADMHETYTFKETNGVTEVSITTNADDEYKPIFEQAWPRALLKLKALCEARNSRR